MQQEHVHAKMSRLSLSLIPCTQGEEAPYFRECCPSSYIYLVPSRAKVSSFVQLDTVQEVSQPGRVDSKNNTADRQLGLVLIVSGRVSGRGQESETKEEILTDFKDFLGLFCRQGQRWSQHRSYLACIVHHKEQQWISKETCHTLLETRQTSLPTGASALRAWDCSAMKVRPCCSSKTSIRY